MSLKARIALLVVLMALAISVMMAYVFWSRDREQARHYRELVSQSQGMAWNKLQQETAAALHAYLRQMLEAPELASVWMNTDLAGLDALVPMSLRADESFRVDWFDRRRSLVRSSSSRLQQDPLVDFNWLNATLVTSGAHTGISHPSRQSYYLVVTQRFEVNGQYGVLALGRDLEPLLREMSRTGGGENFLVNLRGREVAGTQPAMLDADQFTLTARRTRVQEISDRQQRRWRLASLPLLGPDQRAIGTLLSAWDISEVYRSERRHHLILLAGLVTVIVTMGMLAFVYLGRAMQPLSRSIEVLQALAQGDLRAAPDDDDQRLPAEAGAIARGVAALRGELLNLQVLRDERIRVRQQQERLIRRELRTLADGLDKEARQEILTALDDTSGDANVGDNTLARLAATLARMSGLVLAQQDRLVVLLNQVREAMQQQAALASLRQELEIARTMQLSILPREAPETRAVEVATLMIPAKEVGGDFYDYFPVGHNRLGVVIADVSGKGIPAAFFMAISRTLLKSIAQFLSNPAEIVRQLNDQLCADNEQMMFVTTFFGILDLESGDFEFVNAGHNPPLLLRPGGDVLVLPHSQNPALAVMDGLLFRQGSLRMQDGDTLLLYTDGVTEAQNQAGELFGDARLLAWASQASLEGQADLTATLLSAVRAFEDGAAQADDITCVALRRTAQEVPVALAEETL